MFLYIQYQSIESIYEFFSKKEAVDNEHILLYINKKRLSPFDTPNSIKYASDIIGNIYILKTFIINMYYKCLINKNNNMN